MYGKRFKKGTKSKKAYDVLMFDLEALVLDVNHPDNVYYLELLKRNIKDIFGIKEGDDLNE